MLDRINIVLMLISGVAALFFPFEIFLFSYAVLGPLHYLTEISWLHQKSYFLKNRLSLLWPFVSAVIVILLAYVGKQTQGINLYALVVCVSFFSSFVFVAISKSYSRIIALGVITGISLGIWFSPRLVVLFALFLPTILHVFLFTFCFMVQGALKNKSRSGLIAAMFFIFLSIALIFSHRLLPEFITVGEYARHAYASFQSLNTALLNFFGITFNDQVSAVYFSPVGIALMRFIAFAYTYHYLNWFSKTSIIRWHLVPKLQLLGVIVVWLAAVIVYVYDYRLGFIVLYFLSTLHVIMEFPLNQITFLQLGKQIQTYLLKKA